MNRFSRWTFGLAVTALFCMVSVGCAFNATNLKNVSKFEEIPVAFEHKWEESTHPFSGAAVIDVNSDGIMEIFVGGGKGQADVLLSYRDKQLVDIIDDSGLSSLSATYGSVSIDIDNDNDVDLIVAREDGLYQYLNQEGKFVEQIIPLVLPNDSVPFSVAVSDIDHDGDADLYVSVFVKLAKFRSGVFNDPEHAKRNILLLNNGDSSFTDITQSSNTAGKQNTFLSVFSDLNNDGWQDLILAQNTGEVEIFRNNKDRTFTSVPSNSDFGYWMGLAVGDIDKDGDQDLFFSNIGGSIPAFLTTGDIADNQQHTQEWLLLRNDGEFKFSDVSKEYNLTGEGFAWGAVFEDLNLDGHLDLLVAQNYIKWPIHKLFKLSARNYLQTPTDNTFQHSDALGLNNPHFGQSPVIADLNNDGKPDVLWLNMNGAAKAFLNRSTANFFAISISDSASLLGARLRLDTTSGKSYTREVVTSTGMLTDQTPNIVFGLGEDEQVKRLVIMRTDGSTEIIESADINMEIPFQVE
jgi:hypothetical protein